MEIIVPVRTTANEDMRVGWRVNIGIEAAGGNHQTTIFAHGWEGATAMGAKGPLKAGISHAEGSDQLLPLDPIQLRRHGKKIRAMGGSTPLPAAAAMAKKESVEITDNVEFNLTTQT